jgi:hypothetical protein
MFDELIIKKQEAIAGGKAGFIVPALGLQRTDGSWHLIPNPQGQQAAQYPTLEEAISAVHAAGFTPSFEGRSYPATLPNNRPRALSPAPEPLSGSAQSWHQQWQACFQELTLHLADKENAVVIASIEALGEWRYPQVLPALWPLLEHEDGDVRTALAVALARQNLTQLLPALGEQIAQLAHQPTPSKGQMGEGFKGKSQVGFRRRLSLLQTMQELGKAHPPQALITLLPWVRVCLQDEHWLVRQQAATVLSVLARQVWQQQVLQQSKP